jgi:hypothetical protein
MSGDDITIDVGMNPSQYLSGAQQIQVANQSMMSSMGQVTGSSGMLHKALELVTPGRVALAAWGALATQAGNVQQSLGTLRATSSVTSIDVGKLTTTMHALATEFPIGNQGAMNLVQQFTKMGVSSAGSEAKIASLSSTMVKFAGATGSDLTAATAGMVDFARATGNVNVDPKQFNQLSNSVAKVSAVVGASSDSVAAFGKNIGPVAVTAGIGAAAITGISGAFSHLGEDGIGASTAVNKMLSDMSRAVRDGTPDLAIYSQAVGKTTKEFTALYKANPVEALTQVTEAISQSAKGPRLLEQMGLDSVRTMKALTALSASGGLRPAVAAAVSGYNSDVTTAASETAFKGLNNEATKLQATMSQLGEHLGEPLLGPLTVLTKALELPVSMLNKLAGSGIAQGVATIGVGLLGAGILAKGIPRLLGTIGLGRQLATSTMVSSAFAGDAAGNQTTGFGYGRGGPARNLMGEGVSKDHPYGLLDTGLTGGFNTKVYEAAKARGEAKLARETRAWQASQGGADFANTAAGQRVVTPAQEAIWSRGTPGSPAEYQNRDANGRFLPREQWHLVSPDMPAVPGQIMVPGRPEEKAYQNIKASADRMREVQRGAALARGIPWSPNQSLGMFPQPAGVSMPGYDAPEAPLAEPVPASRAARIAAGARSYIVGGTSTLFHSAGYQTAQAWKPADERGVNMGYLREDEQAMKDARAENVTRVANGLKPLPLPKADLQGVSPTVAAASRAGSAAAEGETGFLKKAAAFVPAFNRSMVDAGLQTKTLGESTGIASKHVVGFGEVLKSMGSSTKSYIGAARGSISDAAVGGSFIAKGAMSMGGALSGMLPFMAITAAIGGITKAVSSIKDASDKMEAAKKAELASFAASDVNAPANRYRAAAGLAATPPMNVGATGGPSGGVVAPTTTLASLKGGFTAAEIASSKQGKIVTKYSGKTNTSILNQIMAGAPPGGYSPEEAEGIRVDLMRQGLSEANAVQIISAAIDQGKIVGASDTLPPDTTSFGKQVIPSGAGTALAKTLLETDSKQKKNGYVAGPEDASGFGPMPLPFGAKEKQAVSDTIDGIAAKAAAEGKRAGRISGQEALYSGLSQGYTELGQGQPGPDALENYASKAFFAMNPAGGDHQKPPTVAETKAHGDNFAEILAARGGTFKNTLDSQKALGLSTGPGAGLGGKTLDGETSKLLADSGDAWGAGLFSNNNSSKFGKILQEAIALPNAQNLQAVINATVAQAQLPKGAVIPTGSTKYMEEMKGLQTYITNLQITSSKISSTSPEGIVAATSLVAANNQMAAKTIQATPNERLGVALAGQMAAAQVPIGADTQQPAIDAQKKGALDAAGTAEQIIAAGKARLMAQFQMQVQEGRMNKAFQVQQAIAQGAYERSVRNTTYSYNLQTAQAKEDFNKQQKYAQEDYDLTRKNEVRDFNIGMARAEQDYLLMRKRAIRDFNISVKRMIEDSAANMYDPYTRIQTKAVWDIGNLMVNLREQNDAMAKQKAELDKLRKMGVSQQVMDQLKLGDAANAQQVSLMVADLSGNKAGVAGLNKAGSDRSKAATALSTDPSNVANRRATEDFNKQMSDAAINNKTQVERSTADLNKTLGDQLKMFNINIDRSTKAYELQVARGATAFTHSLGLMAEENAIARQNARDALGVTLGNMHEDILNADKVINGDMTATQKALTDALAGKSVDFKGLLVNDTAILATDLQSAATALMALYGPLGLIITPVAHVATKPAGMSNQAWNNANHGKAEGGSINGYSPHSKADNIPTWLTAGEFVQPVDTVKHYGVNTMEKLRTKQIPREAFDKYEGYAEGGLVYPSMRAWAFSKFPQVGSAGPYDYRPGTGGSYHAQGSAVDLSPPSMKIFATIANAFGTAIRELIYTPAGNDQIKDGHKVNAAFYAAVAADHFNHVHWAMTPNKQMDAGSPLSPFGSGSSTPDMLTHEMLWGKMNKSKKGIYKVLLDESMKRWDKLWPNGQPMSTLMTGLQDSGATSSNSNTVLGQKMAKDMYNWQGSQWSALNKLWTGESHWNNKAQNPGSTAFGIAQFLDQTWKPYGAKTTDAASQIKYGLEYIKDNYQDPANAWAKWNKRSPHWYDEGGVVPPGETMVKNDTGKPEALLNPMQWELIQGMLTREQGKEISSAGCVHMTVVHNETITNDHRNDFGNATITVVSGNPDDMANKLARKATAQRITQTRGVQWTPATR